MASELSLLNAINEIAYESGAFDWQMFDSSYTNPDGVNVSFTIVSNQTFPIERYLDGVINTYKLLTGGATIDGDANSELFNTVLSTLALNGTVKRKYAVNKIPFANYDIIADQGVGGQRLTFKVIFTGTMYLTAYINFMQVLWVAKRNGLGILNHPFYGEINNVLPIEVNEVYEASKLNSIILDVVFLTSDITHLVNNIPTTNLAEISKWFIGVENAITSISGTLLAGEALTNNLRAQL